MSGKRSMRRPRRPDSSKVLPCAAIAVFVTVAAACRSASDGAQATSAASQRAGAPLAASAAAQASGNAPPTPGASPDLDAVVGAVRAGRDLTPRSFPRGARAAVLLTFDFDAELASYGVGRQPFDGHQLAPLTSAGEFDARRGVPRILALLAELHVPATFAVPAKTAELHPQTVRDIVAAGHEVACHGDRHEDLQTLTDADAERAMFARSLAVLRGLGADPRGFRAPFTRLSSHTLRIVKELGLRWDSSLLADDVHPYELVLDGAPSGVTELPISFELDDWSTFGSPNAPGPQTDPDVVLRTWNAQLDGAVREGGVVTIIMHPQVMGRFSRLAMLRTFITEAQHRPDGAVWFARASDVLSITPDDAHAR